MKTVIILCVILLAISTANAGLISHYEFNGNANDSWGTNDGTLVENAGISPDPVRGSVLSLDGNGDYVNLGNDISLKPQLPITLAAWIKPMGAGPSSQQIIGLDSQATSYYGVAFMFEINRKIGIAYTDGGPALPESRRSKVEGNTVLNYGQWYHVAVVIQGPENMQIYVNGVDDGGIYTGTGGDLAYSNAISTIGSRAGTSRFFNGYMDNVMIYNEALNADQVKALVPEPATMLLLGLGGLLLRKKR